MNTLDFKKRFTESEDAKPWDNATEQKWFEQALFSAMLHFNQTMPAGRDMTDAAANDWQAKGMRRFVHILTNLTSKTVERPSIEQNLDHRA